jgi:hypothetical protein
MTKLVVDERLRARLGDLTETAQLCDERGHILGYFLPAKIYDRALYDGVEPPISDDELRRRVSEPGGRSLAEILADLQAR